MAKSPCGAFFDCEECIVHDIRVLPFHPGAGNFKMVHLQRSQWLAFCLLTCSGMWFPPHANVETV